jgi:hypothetical protein
MKRGSPTSQEPDQQVANELQELGALKLVVDAAAYQEWGDTGYAAELTEEAASLSRLISSIKGPPAPLSIEGLKRIEAEAAAARVPMSIEETIGPTLLMVEQARVSELIEELFHAFEQDRVAKKQPWDVSARDRIRAQVRAESSLEYLSQFKPSPNPRSVFSGDDKNNIAFLLGGDLAGPANYLVPFLGALPLAVAIKAARDILVKWLDSRAILIKDGDLNIRVQTVGQLDAALSLLEQRGSSAKPPRTTKADKSAPLNPAE